MSLLFYRPLQNATAAKLQDIIENEFPGEGLEIFHSTGRFAERLRQSSRCNCAAVLLTENMSDLKKLFTLKNLLTDIRIIIILPDRSDEAVSTGYKFRPRFLSYMDSDFSDVAVVLKKIVQLMKKNIHENGLSNMNLN